MICSNWLPGMEEGKISCVMFDLDGTLLDSESKALEALRKTLSRKLGRNPKQQELDLFKGTPWLDAFGRLFPGEEYDVYDLAVKEWDGLESKHTLYDGILELIKELRARNISLALVSSKKVQYINADLEEFALKGYFQAVIGSDDTVRHKPDPDPILECLKRIGKSPPACVYVGDQPTDVWAARSAGVKSAAALWGSGDLEYLKESKPDYFLESPSEAIRVLLEDE